MLSVCIKAAWYMKINQDSFFNKKDCMFILAVSVLGNVANYNLQLKTFLFSIVAESY